MSSCAVGISASANDESLITQECFHLLLLLFLGVQQRSWDQACIAVFHHLRRIQCPVSLGRIDHGNHNTRVRDFALFSRERQVILRA